MKVQVKTEKRVRLTLTPEEFEIIRCAVDKVALLDCCDWGLRMEDVEALDAQLTVVKV
ncbi:hypothetical protein [Actinomadura oligospora]|uniref:hypothetical protein n=1 Tax=Actinomadura oligospora TaxID=111804 RepID=UPI0012F7680A|nr:hypothetical protein [Actinomadura oligospora]